MPCYNSLYHPVYPENVSSEEMVGALYIDCDNDNPSLDDIGIALPDPDSKLNREVKEATGEWPKTGQTCKRLVRTPKHNPIP
jgi:hypothetical protein